MGRGRNSAMGWLTPVVITKNTGHYSPRCVSQRVGHGKRFRFISRKRKKGSLEMARWKVTVFLAAVLVWSVVLTGCKDSEKEKAIAESAQAKTELVNVKGSLEKAISERDGLRSEMARLSDSLVKSTSELAAATQERDALVAQVASLTKELNAAAADANTAAGLLQNMRESLQTLLQERGQIGISVPAEAVVLFDGKDFSNWVGKDGNAVRWEIVDGAMKVKPGTGSITTKQAFGDFRLHIEFNVPVMGPEFTGEKRGNSGVYLQNCYEIQILDSYGKVPGVGDCGAIYNFKPPDKNACKEAGQWQSYDIFFRSARFEGQGENLKKVENARVTVLQNDVVIHSNIEVPKKSGGGREETPAPGPIMLQDHRNKMQFRNIWIVPL